jgi:hypothetical protein
MLNQQSAISNQHQSMRRFINQYQSAKPDLKEENKNKE